MNQDKTIVIDGVRYVPLEQSQQTDVADKFIAEAMHLIRQGKNAGAVFRKLQAARNVLQGRVVEPERLPDAVANAPVDRREPHVTPEQIEEFGKPGPVLLAIQHEHGIHKVNGSGHGDGSDGT